MTETKTPSPSGTPSPTPTSGNSQVMVGKAENPTSVFVGMAWDMSWRLAIVVLVPIVGAFELDSHFNTTPFLTVLGFLVAIAGVVFVLRQTLRAASRIPVPGTANQSVSPSGNSTAKEKRA
jgi:F0F1-type ATP synthase assembly protein I